MNSPTTPTAPSVRIVEIAFTGYPVTDLARARAFYEKVLGLKQSTAFEHDGKAWIEYDIGPGTLAISNMMSSWKPSPDGPSIAFEVADFDAAVAALRQGGDVHAGADDWRSVQSRGRGRSRWQWRGDPSAAAAGLKGAQLIEKNAGNCGRPGDSPQRSFS